MANRTVSVIFEAVTSAYERGIQKVRESTQRVQSSIQQMSGSLSGAFQTLGLGITIKEIGHLADAAFKASDEMKTLGLMWKNVTKGMGQDADDFVAKNSKTWGQSTLAVQQSMAKFYSLLKARGMSEKEAASLSERYVSQAANFAAATGYNLADATDRVSAIIRGEYDSVEQGYLSLSQTMLNDESLKVYKKKWNELSEAERANLKISLAEKQYQAAGLSNIAADSAGKWANMTARLSDTWKIFLATIGTPVLQTIAPIIKGITDGLAWWVQKLQEGNPIVTAFTVAIGIFAAGMLIYTAITAGATAITAAFAAIMAIITSPITIVIAIIAALVGIIVYLWKTNEGFRNFVKAAWEAIKKAIVGAWEAVKVAWDKAVAFFTGVVNGIKGAFSGAIDFIVGLWNGLWNTVKKIGEWVSNLWGKLTGKKSVTMEVTGTSGGDGSRNAAGGIFTGFSKYGNDIFGEAGHEALIPLSPQGLKPFAQALGRYGNVGGGVTVTNMYVRNDGDIKKIADELHRLQQSDARKKGYGYGY